MAKQDNKNSASKDAELNKATEAKVSEDAKAEAKAEASEDAKTEAQTVKPVSFTVDKKKYTFKVKSFRFKGNLVTAEEALKNEALLSILVETKSFIIKES